MHNQGATDTIQLHSEPVSYYVPRAGTKLATWYNIIIVDDFLGTLLFRTFW